jgi:hypothetical protein
MFTKTNIFFLSPINRLVFITTSTLIIATFIDSSLVHSQGIVINDGPDPDNISDFRETTYTLLDITQKSIRSLKKDHSAFLNMTNLLPSENVDVEALNHVKGLLPDATSPIYKNELVLELSQYFRCFWCVSHQITPVVGNIYLYLACQLEINYIINNNVIEYANYTYPELQNIIWEKFTKDINQICITKN